MMALMQILYLKCAHIQYRHARHALAILWRAETRQTRHGAVAAPGRPSDRKGRCWSGGGGGRVAGACVAAQLTVRELLLGELLLMQANAHVKACRRWRAGRTGSIGSSQAATSFADRTAGRQAWWPRLPLVIGDSQAG